MLGIGDFLLLEIRKGFSPNVSFLVVTFLGP